MKTRAFPAAEGLFFVEKSKEEGASLEKSFVFVEAGYEQKHIREAMEMPKPSKKSWRKWILFCKKQG